MKLMPILDDPQNLGYLVGISFAIHGELGDLEARLAETFERTDVIPHDQLPSVELTDILYPRINIS